MNAPRSHGPRQGGVALLAGLAGPFFALVLSAQTVAPLPPPTTLKKMSLDELMDLQVTSVSKRPEKLSETA